MELKNLIRAKEGENLEFKEARNEFDFDTLVKYLCALSNEGGGTIAFGISDRRPRKIVGSQAFPQPEETRRKLIEKLHVRVDFEEFLQPEGRVLAFTVASHPIGQPIMFDGIAYSREGDKLVKMPSERFRDIFDEAGHDFSADICPGATLADLDKDAIDVFRQMWCKKSGNTRIKNLPDIQLLRDCDALTEEGITYAALILFGKAKALTKYLAQAEIVFEYRATWQAGPAGQREELREAFFNVFDKLWNLVNLRNTKQHYQEGFFVFDIPTFNETVIREAILNAVSHRNYQHCGSIFVVQYPQSLVITSPGGLPPGITLKNILEKQAPRNRRIADILCKCGLVERAGQGMNLIFESSVKEAKALPSFEGTDEYFVSLTLNGMVLDSQIVKLLNCIGEETLSTFTTEDFLVLNYIFMEEKLPLSLRSATRKLLRVGLIEKSNIGNYILSRRYYSAIGKEGEYSRKLGLDRETNKKLLINHLEMKGDEGASIVELEQVLHFLSRRQIQVLLNALHKKGQIYWSGSKKNAKWHIEKGCEN